MWRNRSLIYPTVTFLLLIIGATLAVGYTVNFAILEDVLQERMVRQAQQVSNDVSSALEHKIQRLERFKDTWMASASWSRDAESDPRLVGKGAKNSPDLLWEQLSGVLSLWGVDFVLLLDPAGHVTHRMPANFGVGQPLPKNLLEQVQSEAVQERAVWHVARLAGAWHMMLFAPLKIDDQSGSHRVVFGQSLERVVTQLHQETPERLFLLAATDGIAAGSLDSLPGAHFHPEIAAASVQGKTSRMVFDSSLPVNLYYKAIPFLDQTFSLVVPVALDEVRHVLANSRQRLMISFFFLVVLLAGLGLVMDRIILRPLRQLRKKAAIMVQACSGHEQLVYLNPEEHGNEIIMLDRAMEEASIKLYAHVAHLLNTKHLLEGLSLKDPITMLGNRRMLDEFLSHTLGQCKRRERQVAVILLQPDLLDKRPTPLNTEEQDQIYRQLAERLRNHLRGEDLAFRITRNEFVAFAPECGDEEQVLSLVHRLHGFLSGQYRLDDGREVTFVIRMGVAVSPDAGEHVELLLDNARAALVETHKGGRYPFFIYNYPNAFKEEEE